MDTHTSPISTAIIIVAGKGTRLGALTATQPKCLVPLVGVPMLGHILERLSRAGITRMVLVVEHLAEQVEAYVQTLPYHIVCVRQSSVVGDKYGTAAAIAAATTVLDPHERALVMYGDSLFSVGVFTRLTHAQDSVICVAPMKSVRGYGEVIMNAQQEFVRIDEKPQEDHPGYINAGVYVCTSALLRAAAQVSVSPRNEYEFTDALVSAHTHGACIHVQLLDPNEWITVTSVEDISRAEAYVS